MRAALAVLFWTGTATAQTLPPADIYVIGERHDNPSHHEAQAELIDRIDPTAILLEMLDPAQAGRLTPDAPRDPATIDALLDWSERGWPDISIYMPVFTASDAPILGAAGDPGDLSAFGLDEPLSDAEQAAREALQAVAHCDALPAEVLPDFVARQREIDATFAARTLDALDRFGPPVVLITGNGHARADWGVPAAIARVRPDVEVTVIVQGEEGSVPPGGDIVLDAPAPDGRPDPCDAFR